MSLEAASLRDALAGHPRIARVVVAEARGSAPRESGAAMLVWPEGQTGTIGGGALEHAAAQAARAMLAQGISCRLSRHALGPDLGQCCGGSVTLLSEIFDLARLRAIEDGAVFARPVTPEAMDAGAEMPLAVRRLTARARDRGEAPAPLLVDGWFVEPVSPPRIPVWIWGAGHVGRALISVLAPLPDLAITWLDTSSARFPEHIAAGVTALPAPDMAAAMRLAPRNAHHLVLTYSHALDFALCDKALGHGFATLGLIGSATKWARFRSRLQQAGHATAQIERITCPIGDPALGKHPQAIAVGVARELLQHVGRLRNTEGGMPREHRRTASHRD